MKSETLNVVAQIATTFMSFLGRRKAFREKKRKNRPIVKHSGSK